jgi:hypothetical protein
VYSFVGMTATRTVGTTSSVNVYNAGQETKALTEVVVVGYGVQKENLLALFLRLVVMILDNTKF